MQSRRRILLSLLALASFPRDVSAQAWPSRPIRAIVPFGAGSAADIVPRLVLEQVAARLGQPIVIENRVGAGGTIGATAAANAEPDGYTLLAHSSAHTLAPALYPGLSYHPAKDFTAGAALGASPFILVTPPGKGYKSVNDLVAAARAQPAGLNFASVGFGSASHLSAERFIASAGVKATHIPFKGGPEAMTEVIAGRIDFFFVAASAALSNVREGKLAALAVNSSARSQSLADVPTLAEAGIADAEYPLWFGLFLPARAPREIVDRLNRETMVVLEQPKIRQSLAALGVDPMPLSPSELDARVKTDVAMDAALARKLGLAAK